MTTWNIHLVNQMLKGHQEDLYLTGFLTALTTALLWGRTPLCAFMAAADILENQDDIDQVELAYRLRTYLAHDESQLAEVATTITLGDHNLFRALVEANPNIHEPEPWWRPHQAVNAERFPALLLHLITVSAGTTADSLWMAAVNARFQEEGQGQPMTLMVDERLTIHLQEGDQWFLDIGGKQFPVDLADIGRFLATVQDANPADLNPCTLATWESLTAVWQLLANEFDNDVCPF